MRTLARLKRVSRLALGRAGFDVVRTPRLGTTERALRELLSAATFNDVVDIGANVGQFGSALRTLGYTGRIHSVEPFSDAFAELQARAANDHLWSSRRNAVGPQPGKALLHTFADSQFNSILPPTDEGRARKSALVNADHEMVEVVTLAALLDSIAHSAPGFAPDKTLVKTDTQGLDLEVLRSGRDFVGVIGGLLFECQLTTLYEGASNIVESLHFLADAGLVIYGIFPNSVDKSTARVIDVNVLAVRP